MAEIIRCASHSNGCTDPHPPSRWRFSIIIPTFQRREVVLASVQALSASKFKSFEVIVVVDGSTDGTADALRSLHCPFPITVIEQPNSGAAAARNRGAAV